MVFRGVVPGLSGSRNSMAILGGSKLTATRSRVIFVACMHIDIRIHKSDKFFVNACVYFVDIYSDFAFFGFIDNQAITLTSEREKQTL